MARRRRGLRNIDWTFGLEADKLREIVAVLAVVAGSLFLLSVFGLGGGLGDRTQVLFLTVWGSTGYLIPLGFLWLGIALLLPARFPLKRTNYVGFFLLLFSLPLVASLIVPTGGGGLGDYLASWIEPSLSRIGGLMVGLGVLLVGFLLISTFSLTEVMQRLTARREITSNDNEDEDNEPRVSVFTTVKNRLALRSPRLAAAQSNSLTGPPVARALLMRRDPNWNFPPLDIW